jgi:alkaline phosphatase D
MHLLSAGCMTSRDRLSAVEADLTIAMGSCVVQGKAQPIWDAIVRESPDIFLFLGDNIYGDTEDMAVMRKKYDMLAAEPGYQAIQKQCPVLAVWDDHDYGVNDGGAEYPMKADSKREFLRFFGVSKDSPRWSRAGNYDALVIGEVGRRVQFILLDTRSFRSGLKGRPRAERFSKGVYWPNRDVGATVLGDAQWAWLAQELQKPAEVRLIATSIQAIPEEHPWEKWSNFPHEHERFMRLLGGVETGLVMLVSGDRHIAELSARDMPGAGDVKKRVFELTSSSMNHNVVGDSKELNRHRVGPGNYLENNFGIIKIHWEKKGPLLQLQVRDVTGNVVLEQTVR